MHHGRLNFNEPTLVEDCDVVLACEWLKPSAWTYSL